MNCSEYGNSATQQPVMIQNLSFGGKFHHFWKSDRLALICFDFRLAEILEEEAEVYMRKDPDPFDERHPSRTDPESQLGKNLKLIFKKEQFMNR